MKHYVPLITLLISSAISYAQVGIGTSSPAGSSQLDVTSTTKGFLPPRMTTNQRDLILFPSTDFRFIIPTIEQSKPLLVQLENGLRLVEVNRVVQKTQL